MALVPVPPISDNTTPLKDLEMTNNDFATKQEVTTSMDQPKVNIVFPLQISTQKERKGNPTPRQLLL